MKGKKRLLLGVFIGAIVFFTICSLHVYSSGAITQAKEFTRFLGAGKLENAFALMEHRSDATRDFETFKKNVEREIGTLPINPMNLDLNVSQVRPIQTWGNRIRRFIANRPIVPSEASVDFVVNSEPPRFPPLFEVRLKKAPSGNWEVTYFQSHAG